MGKGRHVAHGAALRAVAERPAPHCVPRALPAAHRRGALGRFEVVVPAAVRRRAAARERGAAAAAVDARVGRGAAGFVAGAAAAWAKELRRCGRA
jgi:hypothetical protein